MKEQPATDSYDIIRRPIITEKATLASENNTIAFEVSIKSTKKQIKGAIENLFNVKVESVPIAAPPSLNCTSVSEPAAPGATADALIVT